MSESSRLQKFNALIGFMAFLVTTVGLFSIVRQMEQTHATLFSSASDHIYARMHDIHKIFIERPYLRGYFYNNVPKPTMAEDESRHYEVSTAAEMLCDFFHQVLVELDTVPEQDRKYSPEMYRDLHDGWTAYIKYVYKSSPAFREHYNANKSWYTSQLAMKLFGEADAELVREAAVPPAP